MSADRLWCPTCRMEHAPCAVLPAVAAAPTTTPDLVRGDVPGLLCRGMPCVGRNTDPFVISEPHGQGDYAEWAVIGTGYYRRHAACEIDWSDRAAIALAILWLADLGHLCGWMVPATHGGKVTAHAGLDAWTVSAILVARSVGRVALGGGPVSDVLGGWWIAGAHNADTGLTWVRSRTMDPKNRGGGLWACERLQPWRPFGWECSLVPDPSAPWTWLRGPETGLAGKLAADRAALADGVALCDPAGIILPPLEIA